MNWKIELSNIRRILPVAKSFPIRFFYYKSVKETLSFFNKDRILFKI